jgi:hypothetical protein
MMNEPRYKLVPGDMIFLADDLEFGDGGPDTQTMRAGTPVFFVEYRSSATGELLYYVQVDDEYYGQWEFDMYEEDVEIKSEDGE